MTNKIFEAKVTLADIKELAKVASSMFRLSANPLKGFKKTNFDAQEFIAHWQQSGYDDSRDAIKLLKNKYGFSESDIEKALIKVFGRYGNTDKHQTPSATQYIQNLINYIEQHGLKDEVIAFLEEEYPDELGLKKPSWIKRKLGSLTESEIQEQRQRDIERFGRARR